MQMIKTSRFILVAVFTEIV